MLHNAGLGGNGVGGLTVTVATPMAETSTGQQQFLGRGSTVWFTLMAAVDMFGLAATT